MRNPVVSAFLAAALLSTAAFAQTAAPTTPATTAPAVTAPSKTTMPMNKMAMVNVNTATAAELTKIPGVSSKIAAEIIKNRPYKNEADLVKKVKGIGKNNVKKMISAISF